MFQKTEQFGIFGKPGIGNNGDLAVGQRKLVLFVQNERPQFQKRNLELPKANIGVNIEPVAALFNGHVNARIAQKIAFGILRILPK